MITSDCPLCGEEIKMGLLLKFGQRLNCPTCDAVLEVVGLNPIKLDWLYFDHYLEDDDAINYDKDQLAECPLCRHEFATSSRLHLGQCVLCPSCDVELEVVWLNPVELNWPLGEGYKHPRNAFQDDVDYIAEEV